MVLLSDTIYVKPKPQNAVKCIFKAHKSTHKGMLFYNINHWYFTHRVISPLLSKAGSFEEPFGKQKTHTSKDLNPELRHSPWFYHQALPLFSFFPRLPVCVFVPAPPTGPACHCGCVRIFFFFAFGSLKETHLDMETFLFWS